MSSGSFGIKPNDRRLDQNSIPLRSLNINASIKESLATVELNQTFMNLNTSPLECEYSFPIKEECVITSLYIQFSDGTKIKAQIEEESKAQEIYQDTISSGGTAVLAKSDKSTITFNIGNIQPNDIISVELKFCFPLQSRLDSWIFTLDNYIFPCFEEGKHTSSEEIKSNVKGCNYYVNFGLEIFSDSSISNFICNEFQFDTILSEDSKHLSAKLNENAQIIPDKSVEISYKTSDANIPKCIIQEHEGEHTAMLSFLPMYQEENEDLEDLEGSGEYLFILDRSGSMTGERIDMAKESLSLLLKSLPQRSKFNIISFGTGFTCMHPASVEYSQATLELSLKQLKQFRADMLSTNIYNPLSHIFKSQVLNDYPRVIFLITDGEVEDPNAVIKLIKDNSNKCRVHTFGIGEEVSIDLVKNAAKAGGGISAFIKNKSEINQKVIAALQKCIMPALTDWTVNWNDEITPSEQRLSTLYYGERFILYSKLGNSLPNSSPVLTCFDTKIRGRREFHINYPDEIGHGEEIRKLWAKNKIEDLEKAGKKKIIEISVKYQVLSPYTVFIAKKLTGNAVSGEMEFIKLKKKEEDVNDQLMWRTSYLIPTNNYTAMSLSNLGLTGTNSISYGYNPSPPTCFQNQIDCSPPKSFVPLSYSASNVNSPPPPPLPNSPPPLPTPDLSQLNQMSFSSQQAYQPIMLGMCPPPRMIGRKPPPMSSNQTSIYQPTFLSNIAPPPPPPLSQSPPPPPPPPNPFNQMSFSSHQAYQPTIPGFCPPPPPPPAPGNQPTPMSLPQTASYQPTFLSKIQHPSVSNSISSLSSSQIQTQASNPQPQSIPKLNPPPSFSPPVYSQASPSYSQTSPSYSPTSPSYSPTSPSYSPTNLLDIGSKPNPPAQTLIENSAPAQKKYEDKKCIRLKPDKVPDSSKNAVFNLFGDIQNEPGFSPPAQMKVVSQKPKIVNYMNLVEIQAFDGFWADAAVINLLKFSPEISEEIKKISLENLIGTLIALAYLNKYCEEQKAEWALIERKAMRWLKKNGIDRNLVDLMIEKI